LGRNVWLPFGKGEIYPNQYIMLMGSAGARKGTAMSPGGKLLRAAGYETFAADSVSKEMFLADMGKKDNSDIDLDLETLVSDNPTECYVMAEEFNDFIGQGDLPFVTRLTKLWDCPAEFRHPKLTWKISTMYINQQSISWEPIPSKISQWQSHQKQLVTDSVRDSFSSIQNQQGNLLPFQMKITKN
jgi:hypothetical protein